MNKKKMIMICILSCLLLSACSKTNHVEMVSNTIVADKIVVCENRNVIKICVDFMYDNKIPDIEVNSVTGEGLDDAEFGGKISVENFEKDFSYKNNSICSYIISIDVGKKKKNDVVMIEGLSLNIDGEEKEIQFKEPLKYTFINEKDNNIEDLQSNSEPLAFCGVDTVLSYGYKAGNDITINALSMNELLNIDNTEIYVNGTYVGDLSCLPLELSKGDKIELQISPQLVEKENNWTNVYTNMIVKYSAGNKEYMNVSSISLLPIDSEDDVKEVIDFMLK